MDRVARLKAIVDEHIKKLKKDEQIMAVRHLNGVANTARLIAFRRGLDDRLLFCSGLLHDLWSYETGKETDHAKPGAKLGKKILDDVGFADDDIDIICTAIHYHSDKGNEHGPYEEALKDADLLQHYLQEPDKRFSKAKVRRLKRTLRELGIHAKVFKK